MAEILGAVILHHLLRLALLVPPGVTDGRSIDDDFVLLRPFRRLLRRLLLLQVPSDFFSFFFFFSANLFLSPDDDDDDATAPSPPAQTSSTLCARFNDRRTSSNATVFIVQSAFAPLASRLASAPTPTPTARFLA